jgi:diadenosine tetraphosphate (Ap4A) HIT family hydrolase
MIKNCSLCNAINETDNIISITEHSFCVVAKQPIKDGHLVIVPKRHVTNMNDLTDSELIDYIHLAEKINSALEKNYEDKPLLVIQSPTYRSVPEHLHIQIVPSKVGVRDYYNSVEKIPLHQDSSDEEMKQMCDKIKKFL